MTLGPRCHICGEQFNQGQTHCPHEGAPLFRASEPARSDPFLGRILLDEYRVERLVGWGAMGRVYKARPLADAPAVAIKILHPGLTRDPQLVRRFQREARIAGQLSHPHIVRLHGQGQIENIADVPGGLPALIMEFLEGRSLRSVMARRSGPLPLRRATGICRQICLALAAAHARGIVHRDLKPANVLLLEPREHGDDFVKVVDFGIAKSTQEQGSRPTTRGTVLGTPAYISPEAALGEPVTAASDVYSIAAVLFECLLGCPPFADPNPVTVLIQHTSQPPPRADTMPGGQDLPASLVDLIDKNLRKQPSERLANAGAFLDALERATGDAAARG